GAVRIDPWKREKAIDEFEKRFTSPQFKAIYLHPWEEHFQCNNEIVYPVMAFAQERSLPVIIESGYPWMSHISQIGDLARLYPTVKILATNAGQLDLSGLTLGEVNRLLKKHENLYLGTSSAVAAEWLADLIQK
ncbi:amidohydrolase family protein, partial [Brevibacillus nitrificans]